MAAYPPYNKSKAKLDLTSILLDEGRALSKLTADSYPAWVPVSDNEAAFLFAPIDLGAVSIDPAIETALSLVYEVSREDTIYGYIVVLSAGTEKFCTHDGILSYTQHLQEDEGSLRRWNGRMTKADVQEERDFLSQPFVVTGNSSCVAHVLPTGEFGLTTLKSANAHGNAVAQPSRNDQA